MMKYFTAIFYITLSIFVLLEVVTPAEKNVNTATKKPKKRPPPDHDHHPDNIKICKALSTLFYKLRQNTIEETDIDLMLIELEKQGVEHPGKEHMLELIPSVVESCEHLAEEGEDGYTRPTVAEVNKFQARFGKKHEL